MSWPPSHAEIAAIFDARATTYDSGAMHRWLAERAVSELVVPEQAFVVDVAAGTGLAGRALRHRQPSAYVVAIDLAAALLRVAGEHGLPPVQADAQRLPFGSQTVDTVLCVSAAAYFPHPQRALAEFARILRPGGACVVQTWRAGTISPTRVLQRAAASVGVAVPDPNSPLGSEGLLRDAMSAAGLTGVRIDRDVWNAPWPDPEGAWRGTVRGPLGKALTGLDPSALAEVRSAFVSQLRNLSAESGDDPQHLLIGTGTMPGGNRDSNANRTGRGSWSGGQPPAKHASPGETHTNETDLLGGRTSLGGWR